jgi:hypothetical protein
MKFMWVYPRNKLNKLEECIIFYGTETDYRKFLVKDCATTKSELGRAVEQSACFAKLAKT